MYMRDGNRKHTSPATMFSLVSSLHLECSMILERNVLTNKRDTFDDTMISMTSIRLL